MQINTLHKRGVLPRLDDENMYYSQPVMIPKI